MHKLLARQIEKLKRKGFSKEEIQEEILKIVSDSYDNFDNQLTMKDRSIKLMSDEMMELNRRNRKEDQAFITTIMNDMADAVLTLSAYGDVVTVNKAAIAILEMAETELVGERFVSLCTEYADFQLLLSSYESYHDLEPEKQFGITLKNAKKQKVFCEITISPLDQSKAFSYVAIIRDVTEEAQSKLELLSTTKILHRKEEELKLLSLVASKTSNAVIIMNANSQIEWVNAGFTKIFGYKIGEIIGKKPREILQGPES
ncbi:MAG: PAS domain-containing protein, partial [Bacteroidota bacterium]